MKIIFYIFIPLFLLSLSGCNFLQGSSYDNYESDEMVAEEEEGWIEEDEEDWIEEEDDEESDEADEADEADESDEDDEADEADDEEEEGWIEGDDEAEEGWNEEEDDGEGKKGFFNLLFGGRKDKKSDDDFLPAGDDQEDSDTLPETSSSNIQIQPKQTMKDKKNPTRQPLNKILKYPYKKAGFLVNTIYIARSNDNLQSISQKIYQQDKTNELIAINSHLKNRNVIVGDKIYYNSPNRPNDNKKILLYYEDNNMPATYYTLSKGENIRKASYKLLGHSNSWKEIWATHPELQSKNKVQDDFTITYWKDDVSAPDLAPSEPEPMIPSESEPSKSPYEDNLEKSNQEETEDNLEKSNQDENKDKDKQALSSDEFAPEKGEEQEDDNDKGKSGIIAKLSENKEIVGIFIVFALIIGLILRLVVKKRKQREFDYTSV